MIASVNLPTALSCAASSNIFILSKNCSTSDAVSVSKPRSINSAVNENTPSGTLIIPDAIPDANYEYQDLSLSLSASLGGRYFSAI